MKKEKTEVISAGIDMGTQRIKVAILKDKQIIAQTQNFVGFEPTKAAEQTLKDALETAKLSREDIQHITATGASVNMAPFADSTISMMGADAKAGAYFFSSARTVIDVGAEDARAIKCDETGIMQDFVVNARCAAGAGTFIEAMARALEVDLEDMGTLSLKAERVASMAHRLGINKDIILVGGVAKDVGFVASLNRRIGMDILIPKEPLFAGAVGAALIADKRAKRKR